MNSIVQMKKCSCLSEERGICRELLQAGVKGHVLKEKSLWWYGQQCAE